jgi:hypothetical protein
MMKYFEKGIAIMMFILWFTTIYYSDELPLWLRLSMGSCIGFSCSQLFMAEYTRKCAYKDGEWAGKLKMFYEDRGVDIK